MSKLLLTSAGLINREISQALLREFSEPLDKVRTLVVAYTQNPEEEFYVDQSRQELFNLGFKDVAVVNMHHQIESENLSDVDIVYVCGGNTFTILYKLRETRLNTFIVDQVNKGAIYIGVSAGSIIAGPDIEIASWGSEGDKNEIDLKDLKGFHFTNIAVSPHFHEELRSEVKEFKKKVDYEVIELTDEQAVFVKDDNVNILG
jgi:dipeptidase E